MFLYFFLFYISLIFFYYFNKKLIALLSLEALMLSTIFVSSFSMLGFYQTFFSLMLLTVMMVLDSVFGVSILISCSRSSTQAAASLFSM